MLTAGCTLESCKVLTDTCVCHQAYKVISPLHSLCNKLHPVSEQSLMTWMQFGQMTACRLHFLSCPSLPCWYRLHVYPSVSQHVDVVLDLLVFPGQLHTHLQLFRAWVLLAQPLYKLIEHGFSDQHHIATMCCWQVAMAICNVDMSARRVPELVWTQHISCLYFLGHMAVCALLHVISLGDWPKNMHSSSCG